MGKDAGKKRWWPDKSNNQINNIWTILFSNYRMALAIGSCRVQSNVEFFSHDKTLTSVNSECLRSGIDGMGWDKLSGTGVTTAQKFVHSLFHNSLKGRSNSTNNCVIFISFHFNQGFSSNQRMSN